METGRQKYEDERWDLANYGRSCFQICPCCERKIDIFPNHYVFAVAYGQGSDGMMYFCSDECKQNYFDKIGADGEEKMEVGDLLEQGFDLLSDEEDDYYYG